MKTRNFGRNFKTVLILKVFHGPNFFCANYNLTWRSWPQCEGVCRVYLPKYMDTSPAHTSGLHHLISFILFLRVCRLIKYQVSISLHSKKDAKTSCAVGPWNQGSSKASGSSRFVKYHNIILTFKLEWIEQNYVHIGIKESFKFDVISLQIVRSLSYNMESDSDWIDWLKPDTRKYWPAKFQQR